MKPMYMILPLSLIATPVDRSHMTALMLELARAVGAPRLLVDGSFVTAKPEPHDVDTVIWLPADFQDQVDQGQDAALELEEMLLKRRPEEVFAAARALTA